jgi:hypothetical protein
LKCEQEVLENDLNNCKTKTYPKFSEGFYSEKVVVFKSRGKMEVEVEVKGTSKNTGRHLELGLLPVREEASAPYVHPKKLGGYYRVHDERVPVGYKKRGTHHSFQFLCPEVILGEKGRHRDSRTW